nr:reverse transcriptase domain-containing protein [Tanacetum cinerariifolium]
MIKDPQFDERSRAYPHKHIAEFVEVCGMFRYGDTNVDAIKLKLFSSSLVGEAKIWFNELSSGVISTWEEMRQAFVSQFFPPAMFDRLMREIQGFTQQQHESIVDAWLCMKDLLCSCHGHGLGRGTIIQIFYHGLDEPTQAILDAEGIFLYKTPNEAHQLLEDRVLLKLDWSKRTKPNPFRDHQSYHRDENRNSNSGEENPLIPRLPEKRPDESEFEKTMREFVIAQKTANDFFKNQFYNLKTKVEQGQKNHQAAIQDFETKFGRISDHQSSRPSGTLPSNTQTNPKPSTSNEKPYLPPPAQNEQVNAVFIRSGKTYNPSANPNTKTAVYLDDSEDEAEEVEKEAETLPKKPTQTDTPPLKAYKPKIPYPQRLNKEKIEARYAKILDMIKEVRINVPLVDVLAGMPNYGKFLKDLVNNKIEYLALADLGASINLMQYTLYALLSGTTLKPTRMSIRLANYTYRYPMGVAENMLVQIEKFVFPVDFVILQIEEDDRVPLILERPFLHTADDVLRVKNKELNLGNGEDRATFHIDKAMQHSHMNDNTCFRMDVIDEITEDELDDLLNDYKPFLNT